MKSLEEVMRMYKLSDELHEAKQQEILRFRLFGNYPVEHPRAIINIAPPASGKSGLNGFGENEFVDQNVVIINSDELKPFHPQINEIAKRYPQYYTKVTDQESNTWTSTLFDTALSQGYNVIFEGTGKNARILSTIKEKMQGYDVTVRGMAVNEVNCLLSILERYAGQVETKGWGRLVTMDHFYETYEAMPLTIDEIEKSGVVDRVEVYKRGATPAQPIKIYDSTDIETGRFPNARYAVLGGRQEDAKEASENFNQKIAGIFEMLQKATLPEEKAILMRLIELVDIREDVFEQQTGLSDESIEHFKRILESIDNNKKKAKSGSLIGE